jgi:hypothetical protein
LNYYLIEYGDSVEPLARIVCNSITACSGHVIMINTDDEKYMGVEKLTEDEFLDICKDINRNSINLN